MSTTNPEVENLLRKWTQTRPDPVCAYIHDLGALRRHVSQMAAALPSACQLFFAMKANPDPRILATLAPLVDGIEVASLGEIETVRALDTQIPLIFGGPGKTDGELRGALRHGVRRIHVESLHELRRLAYLSRQHDQPVAILLRVNLRGPFPAATLHMGGATQFGIDEADIPLAMALARGEPTLQLEGFHIHSLSNQLDAAAHAELISHYIACARAWAEQGGVTLKTLNVGGGIGVNYADLDAQFDWPALCRRLDSICADQLPAGAQLIFECGRYLTASCGFYAAEVLDIKRNHGTAYAVLRGGSHQFRLPVSWQHNHPFTIIPIDRWPYPFVRPELHDEEITIVGQLCTPKDVLVPNLPVDRLRAGDIVLFQYAGAYGWTISHHDFLSHPHPAQIYLDAEENMAELALATAASGGSERLMLQHSALQVVAIDRCVLHERTDPQRVARIADLLASEQTLRNPPIVGTHPRLTNLIVVDGATRVTALRQLGVRHVIAQVVAYDDMAVALAGWNHLVCNVTGAAFCAAMQATAGVALRACPQSAADGALAANLALAYALDAAGSCWLLEAPTPDHDPTALRHAIFTTYARLGPVTRTLERQVSSGTPQVLVVFPTYEKTALVELVQAGHDVPPGITRHTVPERVLRMNLPLSFLQEDAPLEHKQAMLDTWVSERWASQRMRYYQEPTIVFDE